MSQLIDFKKYNEGYYTVVHFLERLQSLHTKSMVVDEGFHQNLDHRLNR